jgi:hypothetical protein
MPRHIPISVAWLPIVLIATGAIAQQPRRAPTPVSQQASAAGGHIRGVVRDDVGSAVGGVMVVAMGTTLAAAKSDTTGRYNLALPPGEYILRAARDGYVSTYREPIRMQTSAELERNITLTRQGASNEKAGLVQSAPGSVAAAKDADHAHDEAAWRLRYLPRTALRDVGAADAGVTGDDADASTPRAGINWTGADASQPMTALFAAGLNGQVNYLTTSLLPTANTTGAAADWMRGIASASVGAPVGSVGDWIVRGAFNAGDLSSWLLHGEFRSREGQAHMLNFGVSHSAQMIVDHSTALSAPDQSRSVGDVYGYDRWAARPWLELDYGARIDRYDYLLTTPALVSPEAGMRLEVAPKTYAVVSASYDRVAPGADEFLPPAATGPWLPPQHTFSSLGGAPLGPESVETYEVGLDQRFGPDDHASTISVRRFRQSVEDQVATLFGVDLAGDSNHYYVASPGDVRVDGWSVAIDGELSRYVRGRVNYSLGQASWAPDPTAVALGRIAPSAVRDGRESVQDLTTSVTTRLPSTSTEVSFVYRMSSAFSQPDPTTGLPQLAGRFDLEVHQALPYQPVRGGKLEVLFAIRDLFYDAHDSRSMYDELLTVKPPLRLVGGIQIRF